MGSMLPYIAAPWILWVTMVKYIEISNSSQRNCTPPSQVHREGATRFAQIEQNIKTMTERGASFGRLY